MIKSFKKLLDIQRRARQKPRMVQFHPYKCHACGHSEAYEAGQTVCPKCGAMGELVQGERVF